MNVANAKRATPITSNQSDQAPQHSGQPSPWSLYNKGVENEESNYKKDRNA